MIQQRLNKVASKRVQSLYSHILLFLHVPAAFGPENYALNKTTQGGIFASQEACAKQIKRRSFCPSTSAYYPSSRAPLVSTPSAHICCWECKQSLCRIAVRSTPDQSRVQTPEVGLLEKMLTRTGCKMYQAQTVQAKHVWMTASVLPFLATPVSLRGEFWLQPKGFSTQQNLQVNPGPKRHDPENMKLVRLDLTVRPKSTNEWMDLPLL